MGARNQILFLIRLYFITLFLQASSVRFLRLLVVGWLAAGLDVRYGCRVYTAGLCPAILSEWLQSYRPV
jgi:hypothetical protein